MNRYKIKKSKMEKFIKIHKKLGYTATRKSNYEYAWFIKKGNIGSCRIDFDDGTIRFETSIPLEKQLYLIIPLMFRFMIDKEVE